MELRKALGLEGEGQEECCVRYEIWPDRALDDDGLLALRDELLSSLAPLVLARRWQRESFDLWCSSRSEAPWSAEERRARRREVAGRGMKGEPAPPARGASPLPGFLWGQVRYGDNVQDEWFVLHLLLEATRGREVTARALDEDGDFVLVEAADALPKWLGPRASKDRVWVRGGEIRLIGRELVGSRERVGRERALQLLREVPDALTLAPRGIREAARRQLDDAVDGPAAHAFRVTLPLPAVRALLARAHLAGAAAVAFHYRDGEDVAAARRGTRFGGRGLFDADEERRRRGEGGGDGPREPVPYPPPSLARCRLAISRCQFAQLSLQTCQALRGYPLPPPAHPSRRDADLGMRLFIGLEALASRGARRAGPRGSRGDGGAEDGSGAGGSGEKGGEAEEGGRVPDGDTKAVSALQQVASDLRDPEMAAYELSLELREGAASTATPPPALPRWDSVPPGEPEGWLDRDPAELERILDERFGGAGGFDSNALVEGLASFLGTDDVASGATASAPGSGQGASPPPVHGPLDFDPESFLRELKLAVGGAAENDGGPGDDGGDTSSEDEGSSFYDGSGSESETEPPAEPARSAPGGTPPSGAAAEDGRSAPRLAGAGLAALPATEPAAIGPVASKIVTSTPTASKREGPRPFDFSAALGGGSKPARKAVAGVAAGASAERATARAGGPGSRHEPRSTLLAEVAARPAGRRPFDFGAALGGKAKAPARAAKGGEPPSPRAARARASVSGAEAAGEGRERSAPLPEPAPAAPTAPAVRPPSPARGTGPSPPSAPPAPEVPDLGYADPLAPSPLGSEDEGSDDGGLDDGFDRLYAQALESELRESRVRDGLPANAGDAPTDPRPPSPPVPRASEGAAPPAPSRRSASPPPADAPAPLNLDASIVASLLASYAEQDGEAGPVQNLAGILGVRLPSRLPR